MARSLTLAVWIFSVNAVFTVFKSIEPFNSGLDYTLGNEMIDAALAAQDTAGSGILGLGLTEILLALNTFLDLILGPITLIPQLMTMIGITGILLYVITASVWMVYGIFVFQLISGKPLKEVF